MVKHIFFRSSSQNMPHQLQQSASRRRNASANKTVMTNYLNSSMLMDRDKNNESYRSNTRIGFNENPKNGDITLYQSQVIQPNDYAIGADIPSRHFDTKYGSQVLENMTFTDPAPTPQTTKNETEGKSALNWEGTILDPSNFDAKSKSRDFRIKNIKSRQQPMTLFETSANSQRPSANQNDSSRAQSREDILRPNTVLGSMAQKVATTTNRRPKSRQFAKKGGRGFSALATQDINGLANQLHVTNKRDLVPLTNANRVSHQLGMLPNQDLLKGEEQVKVVDESPSNTESTISKPPVREFLDSKINQ